MFSAVVDEIADLDDAALVAEYDRIETVERRLLARKAAVVSAIERRSIPAVSGHGSTAAWVRGRSKCASRDATAIVRTARLVHESPVVGEALHAGRVGAAHVDAIGRIRRNPRCGHHLGDVIELFLDDAEHSPFDEFRSGLAQWTLLMDPDGAARDDETRHDNRTATVATLDGGLFIHATGASAHAVELSEIFERFIDTEFTADWHTCVTEHGDQASIALLDRTPAQRRFDALVAIFRRAIAAPADHVAPIPVVNLVIDETTFFNHLASSITGRRVERDPVEAYRQGRCETIDGTPVHPDDVIAAAMIGHVRRVVYDSGGVVIDLGRRQRLFTGSSREAAQLQGRHCFHPGCQRPVQRCQIDHIQPWATGGPTTQANARPACAKHNRWLTHAHPPAATLPAS